MQSAWSSYLTMALNDLTDIYVHACIDGHYISRNHNLQINSPISSILQTDPLRHPHDFPTAT